MPVWHVLHPSTTFTTMAEKAALVRDITALYSLPAFYVNVFFHRFETGDAWDGARFQGTPPHGFDAAALGVSQRPRPFVHFEIDQIAVHITDEDWARQWCDKVIAVSCHGIPSIHMRTWLPLSSRSHDSPPQSLITT